MANKKRSKGPPASALPKQPEESRTAEAVTVGWMLSMLTTLLCELGATGAAWALAANPEATMLAALEAVLVFSALVIGTASLGLAAAAWKLRREAPPMGLSIFSVVIGAAPIVFLIVRFAIRAL